jgi:hypothetical protein
MSLHARAGFADHRHDRLPDGRHVRTATCSAGEDGRTPSMTQVR